MSVPGCVAFQRWSSLLGFVSTRLVYAYYQFKVLAHFCLAEKRLDLSLTCMSAHFDNVMFASLQPSDFLQNVCLHCREMSMIHMRPLKAAGLSFNFGNVIQVVMSVSRCMLQHNV